MGTDLYRDLAINGEFAYQFFDDFFEMFGVECGDFQINDYFETEGFNPFLIFTKTRKLEPLTVKMLVEVAARGRWENAQLRQKFNPDFKC